MSNRAVSIAALVVAAQCTLTTGCSDASGPGPTPSSPSGLIVSKPVSAPSPVSAGAARAGASAAGIVYVSLPTGTAPTGLAATIKDRSSGVAAQAFLFAGGFDPVSLPADAGDTLDLDVRDATGISVFHGPSVVPLRARPVVVRTNPPPHKLDVPLNNIVAVVFSEPIDPRTLTSASLRMTGGATTVGGQITLSADGVRAELAPDQSLQPSTTYTLSLTNAVADLAGESLEPSAFDFTTTSSAAGVGMSQIAFWGCPQTASAPTSLSDVVCGIFAVNADGSDIRQLSQPLTPGDNDAYPAWSPDGRRIALTSSRHCVLSGRTPGPDCKQELYVMNADGSGLTKLTDLDTLGIGAQGAAWSPDGRTIAFPTVTAIYAVNPDGSGLRVLATSATLSYGNGGPTWSPDGARIAFAARSPQSGQSTALDSGGIWIMNADGSNVGRFTTGLFDAFPSWSPDGTRIAFQRAVNGDTQDQQIFVASVGGLNPTQLTTATAGTRNHLTPSWSPDGTQIAFKVYAATTFPDGSHGEIDVMRADGSGAMRLFSGFPNPSTPSWSPVGTVPSLPASSRARR